MSKKKKEPISDERPQVEYTDYIYYKQVSKPVADYVEIKLDGSDYERGELETVFTGLNNTHTFLGKLVELLVKKNILIADEIKELL